MSRPAGTKRYVGCHQIVAVVGGRARQSSGIGWNRKGDTAFPAVLPKVDPEKHPG